MELGNALQLNATDKELSSLWWLEMRSAKAILNLSFFCVYLSPNLFVILANMLMLNMGAAYFKDEVAPCQMKDYLKIISPLNERTHCTLCYMYLHVNITF